MASSTTLQHRLKNDQPTIPTKPPSTILTKPETNKAKAKAKRALRSLVIGISIPFLLTMVTISVLGSCTKYRTLSKPFWFPPLWLIHTASLFSSLCMGLAAWLVWAEGGFHAQYDSLLLYVAQVVLGVAWGPLVLVVGAAWIGLVLCLVHFGTLYACYKCFQGVNPFAKDLVKPCLAWVAYLSFVSCKLVCIGI